MKMTKKEVKAWYLCDDYEKTDLEKWVEDIILNVNVEQKLAMYEVSSEEAWEKAMYAHNNGMSMEFHCRMFYKYSALILEDAIKNKKTYKDMKVRIEHYKNVFKYLRAEVKTVEFDHKTFKIISDPFHYDSKVKALYESFYDDEPMPPHKQNKDMMIAALYNEDVFNAIVKNFKSIYSLQPFNEDIRNIL